MKPRCSAPCDGASAGVGGAAALAVCGPSAAHGRETTASATARVPTRLMAAAVARAMAPHNKKITGRKAKNPKRFVVTDLPDGHEFLPESPTADGRAVAARGADMPKQRCVLLCIVTCLCAY